MFILCNYIEPSLKIDEPEVCEEEDQFFDAGENAHNSSDITPTDLNFSVANEDLLTDGSDQSEQNSPTTAPRSKRQVEPILDNLDDISTEGPSSEDGNNSPRTGEALLNDNNEVPGGSKPAFSSESECNEDAVSQPPSTDAAHQYSTDDFSQDKAENGSKDVPSQENNVNVNNSSKSSMEVMDDESDSPSSKKSLPEIVVPNFDALDENSNADVVDASVENSTENGSEIISENNALLDSAGTEKDEKVPEANEILSMDDSDVDESLQENLDVAIKVIEESQSSPIHTSTAEEPETFAKTDDCTNNDDSLVDTTSKSENILEEFQEDAAKINGDSSELLDSRLCPCQVVLFRIEFDEYALKYLKNKTETAPSSNDHNTDSSMDTSLSKAIDSNSNSESSFSKNPTQLSPPKRRVLTKAARKMIPSPEIIKKTPSRRARNLRASTNSESTRPRRTARDATAQNSKYVHSKLSCSDDEAPLISPNRKRKAVINGTKRSARTVQKPSYPQRSSSRRSVPEEVKNLKKELFIDLSGEKTLKCVSIPIITDLIDSLKEKSCSELIALIEQKEDKLASQITKSKCKRNLTVEYSSRRRKLPPSDTSSSSVVDEDYKTYGKMWRYDDGTSREENNFSLRSETKSTLSKRSSRKSPKVRNYVEDSGSDDEIPLKKAKTRSRGNLTRVERREKKDIGSDDEKVKDLPSECSRFILMKCNVM